MLPSQRLRKDGHLFFQKACSIKTHCYDNLITTHFPYAVWTFPFVPLAIILIFVFAAAIAAVYTPSKRIRNMAVTDTINEL